VARRGLGTWEDTNLTIKKTVSGKVIAANRANARNSTGPRSIADKRAVGHHAVKHGLLAKRLIFRDQEEQAEFNALLDELQDEFRPEGVLERMLAEEVGVCWWKLKTALGWELQEIRDRRKAASAILLAVAQNYNEERLPLFTKGDGSHSAAGLGWDCQELVVRTGTTSSEQEEARSSLDKTGKSDHVQIVAKLNTSMDSILRYETNLKRDLYRAIATLRDIQRERRAGSKPPVYGTDTSAEADE
jgi:hypothetical protein